jgi:golgi SNAP receptor complex member 2
MTSIVELFPKCRKLAYDARQQLAVIQQQQAGGSVSELFIVLEELNRQLDCMDDLVLRETPEQRHVWKRKIHELRQECMTLQKQGQSAESLVRKMSYQSDREELMSLRQRRGKNNQNGSSYENEIQNLAEEGSSLEQSQFMVMDIINQGQANLTDLVQQRQKLRGVTRVVADIGSRLGLTQTTMKIIERRDITDAYLVAACMVVTLIVIYLAWF